MFENERLGYEKVKELALQANDKKSLRKLESLGDYPGNNHGINFKKKSEKLREIQCKYNLAVSGNFFTIPGFVKSPIFKLSDISALIKMDKVNGEIIEFWSKFDIRSESAEYKVPIYYILGENDLQTPYVIAQEYFKEINAPHKKLYLVPNAGHFAMLDQSDLFFSLLSEINNEEKN